MRKDPDATSLSWLVWYYNFNAQKIEQYDVFRHGGFLRECRDAAGKYGEDRAAFEEEIRRSLLYYYWSKCEWEIILSGWPPSRDGQEARKVDVYSQVMINRELFMDYVWNHREELKQGL